MAERTPGEGVGHVVPGKKCIYDVLVQQADVKVTGSGKTFINAIVADVTGRIECIQWDPDEQTVDAFTKHDVVLIRGKCGTYKDKPQITVDSVVALGESDIAWEHVLPVSPVDFGHMKADLAATIGALRTFEGSADALANVVEALTMTPEFLNGPAATFMHHAYVHGLLEHSLSVCLNVGRYRGLGGAPIDGWDPAVVAAGALLHDVGKVYEYTMTGKRLPASKELGHSLIGCKMLAMAAMTENVDPVQIAKVEHIIASHHGRQEWGAVVEPQSAAAWLVHAMDLADSRVFTMTKRVD